MSAHDLYACCKGPRANMLVRADQIWGIEWWGSSMLNFWLRDSQGGYRAIQANVCPTSAVSVPSTTVSQSSEAPPSSSSSSSSPSSPPSSCESGWVRVAMSYDTTSLDVKSNIAMYAHGAQLPPTGAEPGSHTGGLPNSTAGLVTGGLPGIALADIVIYGGAMTHTQLAALTAAPVPPPAPQPAPPPSPTPPAPPPLPPPPPLPRGWPMNNFSDAWPFYYSFNPHAHDRKGPQNSTRRIMFGWIPGDTSQASDNALLHPHPHLHRYHHHPRRLSDRRCSGTLQVAY